ncbi:MAG: FKBP-type peptidyl-prolyl cis-trans isomerase [Candidatus Aenigmatarchaeota archaeon]
MDMLKKIVVIIILAIVVIIAGWFLIGQNSVTGFSVGNGVITGLTAGGEMKVMEGDHVSVDYWGTLEDGTQFDTSEGRAPLEFDVGAGQMIKGFDDRVVGMKEGETKIIKIEPRDAYGEKDSSLVVDVSLEALAKSNITPTIGLTLYGQRGPGVVTAIGNESATIDFNHQLAGKRLIFKITMVKIERK